MIKSNLSSGKANGIYLFVYLFCKCFLYMSNLIQIQGYGYSNINRPWDETNLGSQIDRKSKTWFFTFLNVHVS